MSEPKFFLLKPGFYPRAAAHPQLLGRIVKNYEEPEGIFTPAPDSAFYNGKTYLDSQVLTKAIGSFQSSHNSSLKAKMEALFTAERKEGGSTKFDFGTKVIRSIRLQSYDDVFDLMILDETVLTKLNAWWPHWIIGGEAYMIVGVLTWEDADISMDSNSSSSTQIEGQLPVRQIIAGATGIPTTGNEGNISGGYTEQQSTQSSLSGKNEGTNVFAIQYKRVSRRPTSSKTKMKGTEPTYPVAGRTFGRGKDIDKDNGSEGGGKSASDETSDTGLVPDDIEMDDNNDWQVSLHESMVLSLN